MNILRFRILSFLMSAILLGLAIACSEDTPPLAANVVDFNTSELGFSDDESEATVNINVKRAAEVDRIIAVSFVPTGVEYGVEFTTTPEAVLNAFTITIPAGSTSANFKVTKAEGIFLEGDESVLFTIQSADESLVLNAETTLKLSFSQIVSEGGEMQLQGLIAAEAGSAAGNSVYVDFSANQQTSVARTSWDVGFYSGDEFRVILNNTRGASAVMVNKTDLTTVTSADVEAEDLAIGGTFGSFSAYDSINGDLNYTAIHAVSATALENKVWVINRAGGSGTAQVEDLWIKVRITRNISGGYTMEYAPINSNTITTVDVAKNAAVNFSYFHFENGAVTVEPAKTNWDIVWTWSIYYTVYEEENVPYSFSDLVFINQHNGVKVATVLVTENITYESFSEANLAGYEFKSKRDGIGSDWRAANPPPTPSGVKTDRFYIVQDSQGNVYKLKFMNFHANDGGTRGKPNIKYALVKKSDD